MELKNILLIVFLMIIIFLLIIVLVVAYFAITYGYDLLTILLNIVIGDVNLEDIIYFLINQENIAPKDVIGYVNQSI